MVNGFEGKSDHDLLIVAVTQIESLHSKVDTVCDKQSEQESRLKKLETEHKVHMALGTCPTTPIQVTTMPKRVIISSIGGGIGGGTLLGLVIERLLTRFLGG